jgi:hypothetical protein
MMKVVSDIKRLDNPVNTMEIKDTNIYLKDKIREIIGDSIIHFARADLSKTRIMLRTVVDNGLGDGLCGSTCDNRCTPIIEALSYAKSEFEGIEGLGLMLGEIALRAGNSPYQNDGLKYFLKKFPDILKAERDPERQEELMRVVLNTIDFPLDKEYSAIVLEMAKVNPIKAFAFVDKLIDQMDGSCNRGNGYYPALLENVVTDEVIEVLESINKKSTQFLIERWEQKRIYSKDETLLSEEEQKAAKKERSEQRQLARNSFRDVQGALLEQFDVRL